MAFTILKASLVHVPDISLMLKALLAEDEGIVLQPAEELKLLEYVLRAVVDPGAIVRVAVASKKRRERVVGMIIGTVFDNLYGKRIGLGEHLYVQPAYRAGGAAQMLMQAAIDAAKDMGATEIVALTKRPAFLRRIGFEEYRPALRMQVEERK